jgi:hypothetical protein
VERGQRGVFDAALTAQKSLETPGSGYCNCFIQ